MHSECSSPPTNYNIANNNGQDGFPNGSYVMGKNNNNATTTNPMTSHERRENSNMHSLEHDQDISNIVDQVLSCIGKIYLSIIHHFMCMVSLGMFFLWLQQYFCSFSWTFLKCEMFCNGIHIAIIHQLMNFQIIPDQFEDLQNHNNSSNNPGSSYRDGLETLLCHNCGALMKTKTEETCRQCGTQMPLNNEADNNNRYVDAP